MWVRAWTKNNALRRELLYTEMSESIVDPNNYGLMAPPMTIFRLKAAYRPPKSKQRTRKLSYRKDDRAMRPIWVA